MPSANSVADFWKKTRPAENGCVEWIGAKTHNGYGAWAIQGREVRAHRFAYEMAHGALPDGLLVCHSCDNRACVNVEHLFLGSPRDNTRDMVEKGRHKAGGPKPNAAYNKKLNPVAVGVIRYLRRRGVSGPRLARAYGLNHKTVYAICSGETWAHVDSGAC